MCQFFCKIINLIKLAIKESNIKITELRPVHKTLTQIYRKFGTLTARQLEKQNSQNGSVRCALGSMMIMKSAKYVLIAGVLI